MLRYTLLAFVLALGSAACAPNEDLYPPVRTTSVDLPPHAGADTVASESPRGEVRLTTLGVTRLRSSRRLALRLRMLVANRDSEPWTIHQAEQRIELSTGEFVYPTAPTGEPLPLVEVPPGVSATLNLFFLLPAGMQKARAMGPFTASWTIHDKKEAVAGRSAFDGVSFADNETSPAGAGPFNTPAVGGRMPSAGVP